MFIIRPEAGVWVSGWFCQDCLNIYSSFFNTFILFLYIFIVYFCTAILRDGDENLFHLFIFFIFVFPSISYLLPIQFHFSVRKYRIYALFDCAVLHFGRHIQVFEFFMFYEVPISNKNCLGQNCSNQCNQIERLFLGTKHFLIEY